MLSLVGRDAGYGALVPGMAVVGLGVALFYSSVTTAGVTALDPARSSLAGGIVYMFQVAGGSIGLGLTTTVFTAGTQSALADRLDALGARAGEAPEHAVHGILAGTESATQALGQFSAPVAGQLRELVRDSFVAGLQAAFASTRHSRWWASWSHWPSWAAACGSAVARARRARQLRALADGYPVERGPSTRESPGGSGGRR